MRGSLIVVSGMLTGIIGGGLIDSAILALAGFVLFGAGFVLVVNETG